MADETRGVMSVETLGGGAAEERRTVTVAGRGVRTAGGELTCTSGSDGSGGSLKSHARGTSAAGRSLYSELGTKIMGRSTVVLPSRTADHSFPSVCRLYRVPFHLDKLSQVTDEG